MTNRIRIEGVAYPPPRSQSQNRSGYVRPPLVRLRNMLWLPTLAAILIAIQMFGTPHMLYQYTYRDRAGARHYTTCDYFGLDSQTVSARRGSCPFIVLLK